MTHVVTRRIEIDAGHRLSTHGSKCRNLHGHRYVIEAEATATALHGSGEQSGMALDFAFLKAEMLAAIDEPCDHGLILWSGDVEALAMLAPAGRDPESWTTALAARVATEGFVATTDTRLGWKLYLVPGQPTAETLARHWFDRLAPRVADRSDGLAALTAITVWETPNCKATWRG